MIPRSFPFLPFSVLLVLAALTFWLSNVIQNSGAHVNANGRNDPDMILEKFSAQKLSDTGDIQYKLNADKMTHFPASDSAQLEQVVFVANTVNKPTVEARAPRGSSLKGGDEVILDGGVTLKSSATKTSPAVVFTTPKLTLLPNDQIARSVDGVVAKTATDTFTAASFEFNSETRVTKFERVKLTLSTPKK